MLTSICQLLVAGNFLLLAWGTIPFLLVLPLVCVLFLSARNLCLIAQAKRETLVFPARTLARAFWFIAVLATVEAISVGVYWSMPPVEVFVFCIIYGLPATLQAIHLLLHDSSERVE